MISGIDTLIWQSLASVIIPGKVIHMVVKASKKAIQKRQMNSQMHSSFRNKLFLNPRFVKSFPVMMGLMCIPMIIHPIDHSVEWMMNNTIRNRLYII